MDTLKREIVGMAFRNFRRGESLSGHEPYRIEKISELVLKVIVDTDSAFDRKRVFHIQVSEVIRK